MIIIPMSLLSLQNPLDSAEFLLLSSIGNYSLFPLLFQSAEGPLKLPLTLLYFFGAHWSLAALHKPFRLSVSPFLSSMQLLYLGGCLPIELSCWLLATFLPRLTFAPLMIRSVYASIGVIYCWLNAIWRFLSEELSLDVLIYKRLIWKR